jgi:prepilin-type N-terminal cleavage/methylation domain-containing protein
MRRRDGFTLLEILLAVFISLMVVTIAVPSVSGLLAEQRMKRSFEAFDALVQDARRLSVKERRAYRIVWGPGALTLEPADVGEWEEDDDSNETETVELQIGEDEEFAINFPAALLPSPPAEWVFWPNGTCEPAVITFNGPSGNWQATYHPLTGNPEFRTDL